MPTLDTLVYSFNRALSFAVYVNGVLLSNNSASPLTDSGVPSISGINVGKALDSPVPQCDIELSHLATWITRGMTVTVDLGYSGQLQRVFTGFVQDRERKIAGCTLKCLGKSYSLFRQIQISSLDVGGMTVSNAIGTVLTNAGITDRVISVGAFTLNTSGQTNGMKLEKMPASQMAQQLADIDGSRIYELNSGTVIIKPLEEIPGPTAAYTYTSSTQATAIILNGSDREDPDYFRDKVIVTGATLNPVGDSTESTSLTATALLVNSGGLIQPPLPSGSHIEAEYSNQLLDTQASVDSLATLLLTRFARIPRYLSLEIAGDPRLELGMTIQLDMAQMGLASSRWFVHGISHNVGAEGFKTTLQLRGGDILGGTIDLAPTASFTFVTEIEVIAGVATLVATFTAAAHSPGGNALTYAWSDNQPGTFNGTSAVYTATLSTAGWVGDWNVTLTATDSLGASASSTQTVPYDSTRVTVIPAMYAALNNNASASLDGNATWNDSSHSTTISVGARPSDGVNFGHACYGDSTGHIYRTTDGCTTLTLVYTSAAGVPINDVQWDWRNSAIVWALDENCILYVSIDYGVTWGIYDSLRSVTPASGTAAPAALGNKIGLPSGGFSELTVYIFGGTGTGSPLIAYDFNLQHQWVFQSLTGDIATDFGGDATTRIVSASAPGNSAGRTVISLAWATAGASATTLYSTTTTGPTVPYTRATGLTAGLKTGRFVVGDQLGNFHAGHADRDVWNSTDGLAWTQGANFFPVNTVPWDAVWFGQNGGIITGAYAIALEDTVTPSNGYIVKTTDNFVTCPSLRSSTVPTGETWPASAKGKKISIGAAGATAIATTGKYWALTSNARLFNYNGSSWNTIQGTTSATIKHTNYRISPDGTQYYIDTGTKELYSSINSGATWNKIMASTRPNGLYYYGVHSFALDGSGNIYALVGSFTTATGQHNTYPLLVLKSIDKGVSWNQIFIEPAGWDYPLNANTNVLPGNIDVTDNGQKIYVLTGSVGAAWRSYGEPIGFYSSNGGTSWATRTHGSNTIDFSSSYDDRTVVFSSDGAFLVACEGYPGPEVWYSTDFGVTWIQSTGVPALNYIGSGGVTRPSTLSPLMFFPITDFLTSPYRRTWIYRSTDRGITWAAIANTPLASTIGQGQADSGLVYNPATDTLFWGSALVSTSMWIITGASGSNPVWTLTPVGPAAGGSFVAASVGVGIAIY